MSRRQLTDEHKVARKIAELVNNVELDLDEVGKSIANANSTLSYNRIIIIAESAIEEKESSNGNGFTW